MTLNEAKMAMHESMYSFLEVAFFQVPWGDSPAHYVMLACVMWFSVLAVVLAYFE